MGGKRTPDERNEEIDIFQRYTSTHCMTLSGDANQTLSKLVGSKANVSEASEPSVQERKADGDTRFRDCIIANARVNECSNAEMNKS